MKTYRKPNEQQFSKFFKHQDKQKAVALIYTHINKQYNIISKNFHRKHVTFSVIQCF